MIAPWMQPFWSQLRPDAVYGTGVIQPFWTRVLSPVDAARHAIDPFIAGVRGPGPAVSPTPDPEVMAQASIRVADEFRQGRDAIIRVGAEKIRVTPGQAPSGGVVGGIVKAAQALANGRSAVINHGPQQAFVPQESNMRGQFFGAPQGSGQPQQVSVRPTPFANNQLPSGHPGHPNHPGHPGHHHGNRHGNYIGARVSIPNVPAVPSGPGPEGRSYFHYYDMYDAGAPYRRVEQQSIAHGQHPRHHTFGPDIRIPNMPNVPNVPGPEGYAFRHYYNVMNADAPYRRVERQSVAPFNRTVKW